MGVYRILAVSIGVDRGCFQGFDKSYWGFTFRRLGFRVFSRSGAYILNHRKLEYKLKMISAGFPYALP